MSEIEDLRAEIAGLEADLVKYAGFGDPVARAEVAEARLRKVEAALSRHPRVCDVRPEDDVITCGWKRAVADVEQALA